MGPPVKKLVLAPLAVYSSTIVYLCLPLENQSWLCLKFVISGQSSGRLLPYVPQRYVVPPGRTLSEGRHWARARGVSFKDDLVKKALNEKLQRFTYIKLFVDYKNLIKLDRILVWIQAADWSFLEPRGGYFYSINRISPFRVWMRADLVWIWELVGLVRGSWCV